MFFSDLPILEITSQDATRIIQNPYEAGEQLYWLKDGDKYVGIDNSTHDAWTEEFDTKQDCIRWLRREGPET